MGQFTLKQFRRLILSNPAFQGMAEIDNNLVNDWINLAYIEVTGAIDFEALKRSATLSTVEGVSTYLFPGLFSGMIGIQDRTSKTSLARTSLRNLLRMTPDQEGYPAFYALNHNGVTLWPKPDGVYEFLAHFVAAPSPLENDGDKTILPATWDKAVLILAIETGLRIFNQFEVADRQFTRAVAFMRSRLKDEDLNEPLEGPVRIASSWDDLLLNRPESSVEGF